jgi:hypothetical protein
MNTSRGWRHGQTSLGCSTALSDHADPQHPRPAACGFAPYPSPAGDVPEPSIWARLPCPYGRSPRPEATTGWLVLRPGRLPRRSPDPASRRTPCALLGRAERVPRPGDLHPISSIEYQVLLGRELVSRRADRGISPEAHKVPPYVLGSEGSSRRDVAQDFAQSQRSQSRARPNPSFVVGDARSLAYNHPLWRLTRKRML